MPRFTPEEIRTRFSSAVDFNELFDAFEDALAQGIQDVELYRILFWNNSLSPDEVCMFGEKLVREFPGIAYETYMWLASVFEVTYSAYDNFELAIKYYRKAALANPDEIDPCHDPDLNIPSLSVLIDFVKDGIPRVRNKRQLLLKLSRLYELHGDENRSEYYRRLAENFGKEGLS
jgi:tetratricopeptide (TPR) repeat protein